MNGKLNGALKSSELGEHKDAPAMRKRKPSSDKSAFGTLFSITSRYDKSSTSPSSPVLSPFQPLRLPESTSTTKLSLGSTEPLPTMNMVGDIDGRMHPLHVSNIPDAFGNTMAPLNVSKMFENKLRPPDIDKLLALPDFSEAFDTDLDFVDVPDLPDLSLISVCISEILGVPEGLSNAIVERLPLMVTKILASKLLPPLQSKPNTRPFDVQRLFLKDSLPTANVARLFENSPAMWLKAKPDPMRFWQVVSQTGQIFGRPTLLLKLPPWLLVPLLPVFPIAGPIYLGLKLLAIWARIASTIARLLLTLTKFWKAYEFLGSAMNICVIAIELWQVYGLNASIRLLIIQKYILTSVCLGYFSGTQFTRQSFSALRPPQTSLMTLRGYASHICSSVKRQLRISSHTTTPT